MHTYRVKFEHTNPDVGSRFTVTVATEQPADAATVRQLAISMALWDPKLAADYRITVRGE